MAVASVLSCFEEFFNSAREHSSFALLADYDGTLAPFRVERHLAYPYAGVPELLQQLGKNRVRVGIVSGRSAHEVQRLLGVNTIEIWGLHGGERLLPNGEVVYLHSPPTAEVDRLMEALSRERLAERVEAKPFSVAVHWRGLSDAESREVRFAATRAFQAAGPTDLKICDFDGGIEFRSPAANKACAVHQVKRENPSSVVVYLGDDLTDEDAFGALDSTDLPVLVRHEYRPTAARIWLKPPEQVLALLQFMASAVGSSI
jgi:trehalose-phosphatase